MFFTILSVFCTSQVLVAEHYLLCKSQIYSAFQYIHYETDHFWDRDGVYQKSFNHYSLDSGELEVKYGLTSCDTIGFRGAYDYVEEELDGITCGFSEFQLEWAHSLYSKNSTHYGVRCIGIFPPQSTYLPGLRYGRYGVEAGLFYSQRTRFKSCPVFLYGDAGYRYYQGFPSDQLRQKMGVTFCFHRFFSLDLNSQVTFGLFNGKSRLDQSLIRMNPNYRLWKGEVEGRFRLYRSLQLSVGYSQHFIGQNVGTSGALFTRLFVYF